MASAASNLVLVTAAGFLVYAAMMDLRELKIRNDIILILVGLFFVHALLSGRWVSLHWNVGLAAVMFAGMLICYARNMMGGGDLKLLTVAFLWAGVACLLPFVVIMTVAALLHAGAARLGWVEAERADGRLRVPFAPSIAAGLIGIFMLGCLALV